MFYFVLENKKINENNSLEDKCVCIYTHARAPMRGCGCWCGALSFFRLGRFFKEIKENQSKLLLYLSFKKHV